MTSHCTRAALIWSALAAALVAFAAPEAEARHGGHRVRPINRPLHLLKGKKHRQARQRQSRQARAGQKGKRSTGKFKTTKAVRPARSRAK